jgi:hypothetical protein
MHLSGGPVTGATNHLRLVLASSIAPRMGPRTTTLVRTLAITLRDGKGTEIVVGEYNQYRPQKVMSSRTI